MKKTIICCICLLLWAVIPLSAVLSYSEIDNSPANSRIKGRNNSKVELTEKDTEQIVSLAIEHLEESSPLESKKAILALYKNNYVYCKESDLSPDAVDISKYSDALYNELLTLYENIQIELSFKGNTEYIPISALCGTNTSTSDEYPYMTSVASPWDSFSPDYNCEKEYPCGVSIYGINYLCENGYTAKEALQWYLREFEITVENT